jgi:hypothetical protein
MNFFKLWALFIVLIPLAIGLLVAVLLAVGAFFQFVVVPLVGIDIAIGIAAIIFVAFVLAMILDE